MKVLMVIWQICIAGAEHMVVDLACYLKKIGISVYVVVMTPRENNIYTQKLDDYKIDTFYYSHKKRIENIFLLKYIYLKHIIDKIQPDVIHGHLKNKPLWLYSIIHRRKIIETFHTQAYRLNSFGYRFWYQALYNRNLIIPVCLTVSGASEYLELFGWDKDRIRIIPNPIDLSYYTERASINNEKKEIVFFMAARFNSIKNHSMLLEAFSKYCSHQKNGRLVLAGDGELKKYMMKKADDLGVKDRVDFLGMVTDIPDRLKNADIGVISSDSESFSLFLLECMASGLPVIVTRVGGMRDLVRDNGIFVDAGDAIGFAKAMEELANSSVKREVMGKRSVMLARRYNIDHVGEEYLNAYKELCKI